MKKIFLLLIVFGMLLSVAACEGEETVIPDEPTITEKTSINKVFIQGAATPDFKSFVTITDSDGSNVTVTDAMVDSADVDMATVGTFVITYTFTNANSQTVTLDLTFTINAADAPVIAEVANIVKEYEEGDTAPDFKTLVTITDPVDGVITVTDQCEHECCWNIQSHIFIYKFKWENNNI